MQIKTPTQFQTYNDGICRICALENAADPGRQPVMKLEILADRVPYERRKVGIARFYNAMQENAQIELVLRIPEHFNVSTQDYCIVGGKQYGIYQVQEVRDTMPPSKDLSLKKTEAKYDVTGI